MKALILNSGIGSRMGSLTSDKPKCMVSLYETETILSRQIKQLLEVGVSDFVITIGPFGDLIPNYIQEVYPDISVIYIRNDLYAETNYIYSMYLARDSIQEELILLHGDIVMEKGVLVDILEDSRENLVVVDKSAVLPEKDFKCAIHNEFVQEIGVSLTVQSPQVFLLPVYKLSKKFMLDWLKEIERFVSEGKTKVYAENAFNTISDTMNLEIFDISGDFCMEVDALDDLSVAIKSVL